METKKLWTGKIIISKMLKKFLITYYHFIDWIIPVKIELSYKINDDLTAYEIRMIKRKKCPDCGRKLNKKSIDYYMEYKCPKIACKSLFCIDKQSITNYNINTGKRKTPRKQLLKVIYNDKTIIKKISKESDDDFKLLNEEKKSDIKIGIKIINNVGFPTFFFKKIKPDYTIRFYYMRIISF